MGWEPRVAVVLARSRMWWQPWTWFELVIESEWSQDEAAWLMASRDYESSIGSHGHPYEESMSPEADPANPKGLWRYEAGPKPEVDFAARAQRLAEDAYRKTLREDESMAGKFFSVRKVWRG